MKKSYVALIVIMILLSIVLVIGGTYAYYIATVSGNDLAEDLKITSGKMELTFDDGEDTLSLPNARPGDNASKDFMVENTSTIDSSYDYEYTYNIKLTEVNVTFLEEDLEYTLQEYTDENYTDLKEGGVNRSGFINKEMLNEDNEMYIAVKITRPEISKKHYYRLTLTFKKLEEVDQNYNQGATFSAKINIDDNKDAKVYAKSYKITTNIAKGTVDPPEMDVIEGEDSGIFTVNPEKGYIVENVSCTKDQMVSREGNTFKVADVTSDSVCTVDLMEGYTITTEVKGGTATITPPSQQVTPNTDTDTFTIDLGEGYGIKDITCTNDQTMSRDGNKFTVKNVTDDSKCTVTLGETLTITVGPYANPGTLTVIAGTDSEVFTVTNVISDVCACHVQGSTHAGGSKDRKDRTVFDHISCTNGQTVVAKNGGFVVQNATSDAHCTVSYRVERYEIGFGQGCSPTVTGLPYC